MINKDEYVKKLQAKLGQWNTEIDALIAKAGEVKADAKNEYAEQIESLKAKQMAATEKLDELQQSGSSAWIDLKSGIELAWTAMGEAIDSAKSRFK